MHVHQLKTNGNATNNILRKKVTGVRYCLLVFYLDDMDLQLGLALPSFHDKGFDLNSSEIEIKGQTEATPPGNQQCNIKKRNFLEAFEEKNVDVPQILPLLAWDNQTNRGDDLEESENSSITTNNAGRDADHDVVVGWPPINSWRKKICQQNRRECAVNCVAVENGGGGGGAAGSRGRNSMYVKVKMEGVGIARKVDLSLHHSHQTLLQTLVGMFGKCQQNVQSYQLTYQDMEGDWQLADEDVNWGSFTRSVQRLRLARKRELLSVGVGIFRGFPIID